MITPTIIPHVKIVKKSSLIDTLRTLELDKPKRFSIHDFKTQSARVAISELRKKKYEFKISEEGMVDEYVVTCTKKP